MFGPYIHSIDPIVMSVGGIHLWWYGLSYSLGFLNSHLFLRRNRTALGLSRQSVDDLTLWLAAGVLVGGRAVAVFNEWPFYRHHPLLIPAIWIGGMATHGLIAGGAAGVSIFCVLHRQPFRPALDVLAIAAAMILGCGRIGNFIDGQIVGTLTSVPWAVKFPDVDGYRHPVVLYDALKNFMLIPVLLWVRSRGVPPGRVAALFLLLYPMLRIPIDLLRDYGVETAATGQTLNVIMAVTGLVLLVRNVLRRSADHAEAPPPARESPVGARAWRRVAIAGILAVPLIFPSDSTRDVPAHYGKRHPHLVHSVMYPTIEPPNDKTRSIAAR